MLRSAGILDHRVAYAAAKPELPYRLHRPALLVGIHARRQQTGDDDPPLVLTMVAICATPDPTASWPIVMYSDKTKSWRPIGAAIADFHSEAIGSSRLGRNDEKAALTRDLVETRLTQLVDGQPEQPMVIFVDTQSTRTIWPGLQNAQFGQGPLPGDTLRIGGCDVAVVRCNNDVAEIGRPVTRVDRINRPSDPLKPAAPGRKVYRLGDSTEPLWVFARVSRTYAAKGGELGAKYTRWTLPAELFDKIGKGWHSYTATEIAIVLLYFALSTGDVSFCCFSKKALAVASAIHLLQ